MSQTSARPFRWSALACAALLAAAPIGWPYGYYQFLRLAVTAMSIWIAVTANRRGQGGWSVAGWALALLFNPLIPIYLDREIWMPIDWIAAAFLGFAALKHTPNPKS